MRLLAMLLLATLALATSGQKPSVSDTVEIKARFYAVQSAVDVNSIKALGSANTKASPSILQVTNAEAERVVKMSGGELIGSPKIRTKMDQQAKITTDGGASSYSLDVIPSSKGSDTITLVFKLTSTLTEGNRKTTRSAKGTARVQESKSLLIIENPRGGMPGFLVVVQASRVK